MADDKKPKGEQQPKPKGEKAGKGDKGSKRSRADSGSASAAVVSTSPGVAPRLHEKYKGEVIPALIKQFSYKNANQVPRLQKIVVNMGLGAAVANPKIIDTAVEELRALSGQKPIVTRSKKAIANFKLRAGLPIGAMVTLRRSRMWEFLDRLVSVALPRTRDFKGISRKAFDEEGRALLQQLGMPFRAN
jgi:large subunit ribosomal protein L5